ncbi:MAG TPA: hypothetical protein VHY32_02690 [Caulobacteraceae bacterium]|jgi:hypothetical protein|nr:hypothetical protein [Caulobacteraceae bacterium]
MKNLWKTVASGVAGLSLTTAAGASEAASAPKLPNPAELVKALSDCRAITGPTERLACFDKAAAALDEAQTKGDVVVVDRQQVREVKRQAFGFHLDALSIFNKGGAKEEPGDNAITATVRSAYRNAAGKWVVTLDNGAVWRQIDDEELGREPHQGSQIRVRKATLGSFMMNVDGQPGIRVHRDE